MEKYFAISLVGTPKERSSTAGTATVPVRLF